MKVAEDHNFHLVFLLNEAEMTALFRSYVLSEAKDKVAALGIWCPCIENPDRRYTGGLTLEHFKPISLVLDGEYRNAKVCGIVEERHQFPIADVRYVDIMRPGRSVFTRFYSEHHPKSAQVLRIAKPVDVEPDWLIEFKR